MKVPSTDLPVKAYHEDSVFVPANLLREARRQRNLPEIAVPRVCLLDPDGDMVRFLAASGRGSRHAGWACYHTEMWVAETAGMQVGVVGCAVGASFAVLVAEQLIASGAELVISITSAGQLQPLAQPPYFVLIEAALRDEGTSLHYQPPATWSPMPKHLRSTLVAGLGNGEEPVIAARSWTTDAPYRETTAAIAAATELGAACVEMEAAALYAFAQSKGCDVVCLAHITNTMATTGDDFEKGEANGVHISLALAVQVAILVLAASSTG
ncbi:MAG: hypothetical protein QG671_2132 [Actinomycetota bacterium]|nr:hypothetical protein [Actinomycetota bacterium]